MSADQALAHGAAPVPGHPVAALMMRARNGDQLAWGALVPIALAQLALTSVLVVMKVY